MPGHDPALVIGVSDEFLAIARHRSRFVMHVLIRPALLKMLASLEGFEPPPRRLEGGRSIL